MPTTSEARYTYDDHGRLLEETNWSDGLHGGTRSRRYIYAPQGYRLEEAIPGEASFASRTFTMYDAQGRILEKVIYWSVCDEETADAVGPLAEFERHSLWALGPRPEDECPALRYRYTYEVDETTGNWRKQTINRWAPGHAAFEPFQVIYRTITSVGAP